MAYILGEFRSQTSLFPFSLEEVIPVDHLARVIDLYPCGSERIIGGSVEASVTVLVTRPR